MGVMHFHLPIFTLTLFSHKFKTTLKQVWKFFCLQIKGFDLKFGVSITRFLMQNLKISINTGWWKLSLFTDFGFSLCPIWPWTWYFQSYQDKWKCALITKVKLESDLCPQICSSAKVSQIGLSIQFNGWDTVCQDPYSV